MHDLYTCQQVIVHASSIYITQVLSICCFADLTEMIDDILSTVDDTTFGESIPTFILRTKT